MHIRKISILSPLLHRETNVIHSHKFHFDANVWNFNKFEIHLNRFFLMYHPFMMSLAYIYKLCYSLIIALYHATNTINTTHCTTLIVISTVRTYLRSRQQRGRCSTTSRHTCFLHSAYGNPSVANIRKWSHVLHPILRQWATLSFKYTNLFIDHICQKHIKFQK